MTVLEPFRIAVDTGGTFTDCTVLRPNGERLLAKSPTIPGDVSLGVINAVEVAARELQMETAELLRQTASFVHGSTIGVNALVQRNGSRTGLLMTRGHEESIIIGRVRQKVDGLSEREKIHVTRLHKAEPPLVAWSDIRAIDERIDYKGAVLVRLDCEQIRRSVAELVASGVESLAVCFLWSFVNPDHERQVKELVRREYPQLYVSISSEVSPLLGEYERCVSTCLNAYIGPPVARYQLQLERRLRELGYEQPVLVVLANGGVSTAEASQDRPILTLGSGPAGGILGSRYFGQLHDQKNIICTDVGGTSFDVGLVYDGELQLDTMPVIDQYTYSLPKVLAKSIGAGGGSIAWMDQAGALRVGPRSAGAVPGPACYGQGGIEPTVTDADVVLGYINPDNFLGGRLKLDKIAACAAIQRLAERLGYDDIELASGIFEIVNAQMADLVRKSTIEKGFDPRDFVVLAYGGAGPAHAAFYAADTGAAAIYVPADSSVFSAAGMLTADFVMSTATTLLTWMPFTREKLEQIDGLYRRLEAQIRERARQNNVDLSCLSLQRSVDMRFGMQVHELAIPVPSHPMSERDAEEIVRAFEAKYEATYGRDTAYRDAGVELVNFRVVGTIPTERPHLARVDAPPAPPPRRAGQRPAYFRSRQGFVPTDCYHGSDLRPGQVIPGPAIVERMGDTIVIPPELSAVVDPYGNVVLGATV